MMKWILGLGWVVSFSASAWTPGASPCGSLWSWDSFGRGAKSVFQNGRNLRPRIFDENCYQAGQNYGQDLIQKENESCASEFESGLKKGVAFESDHGGNHCFVVGFNSGRADLNIAAREGDSSVAGRECVEAYRVGKSDYWNQAPNNPSNHGYDAPKTRHCYGNGWYEAPLLPR